MGNTFMQSGARGMRRALERQLPDDANFRRVRFSGGTENRVDEKTGQTKETKDFKAVENPTLFQSLRREGGPEDATSDATIHTAEEVLERGDRVERIADGQPYKVDRVTPRVWQDVLIGYEVAMTEQDS